MLSLNKTTLRNTAGFNTQLGYIKRLNALGNNLKLNSNTDPKLKKVDLKKVASKLTLIKLTRKSLLAEYDIVKLFDEYSGSAVLWLPTKSYYLLYHMLALIECLLSGNISCLRMGHKELLKLIKKRIKNGELIFHPDIFNTLSDSSIMNFKHNPGEQLKSTTSDEFIFKCILRKAVNEMVKEFRKRERIHLGRDEDKIKYQKFLQKIDANKVSFLDYFYIMRLKANYSNLTHIEGMTDADIKIYFREYVETSEKLYKNLGSTINRLMERVV